VNDDDRRAAARDALGAFADAVSNAQWRGQFAADPDGALAARDIRKDDIPDEVLGFLKGLSEEELRLVASLGSVMADSGLSERSQGGYLFWHF
jgi:hypothetical protein